MLRLAADENFDNDVVRGLRRRKPDIDIVSNGPANGRLTAAARRGAAPPVQASDMVAARACGTSRAAPVDSALPRRHCADHPVIRRFTTP